MFTCSLGFELGKGWEAGWGVKGGGRCKNWKCCCESQIEKSLKRRLDGDSLIDLFSPLEWFLESAKLQHWIVPRHDIETGRSRARFGQ
jgi:hypothetical protein